MSDSAAMRRLVIDAFLEVRDDRSVDYVIADLAMNCRFIQACQSRGVQVSEREINLELMNARKAGDLRGVCSKRTIVASQDEYRFASETTVRFLERRDEKSLDHILCDPAMANEFHSIASSIAPGYSAFQYRWAALALRKIRRLRPELVSRIVPRATICRFCVTALDLSSIPSSQGIYLFGSQDNILYIGEARNLFKRISKHLDHSDNKGLARWLWEMGFQDLHLEIHVLPDETPTATRKALEAELIRSRRPIFNLAGAGSDG